MPRLSVALPVYNGAAFLEEALNSILEQDYEDFELLITDNCSSDATEAICRRYVAQDERVRYVRNAQNIGAAANFNLGFASTSGEYFKWCAHDDRMSRNYFGACVRVLDEAAGAAVACGALVEIDAQGRPTDFIEPTLPELAQGTPGIRFRRLLPQHVLVAAVFGVYRRDILERTSLHRPYYSSDCVLMSEVMLLGGMVHVPGAVLYNRDYPNRSSNLHSRERAVWQDPRSAGRNPFELSRRIAHLAEITWRHRKAAPLRTTFPYLVIWTLNPVLFSRVLLELVGAVSPDLRQQLRRRGLDLLSAIVGRRRATKRGGRAHDAPRRLP